MEQASNDPFLARIVALDYYLAPPSPGLDVTFSSLEGTVVELVPIIRIFGSTPAGQRVCLHLHQAFPYFYVPYADDLPTEPVEAAGFLRRLALAINTAMSMSGGMAAAAAATAADATNALTAAGAAGAPGLQDAAAAASERSGRRKQHVADLLLVRAKPMYGYYPDEALFIKVVLYNPQEVNRVSLLLGSGAILGRRFQPYEAHIPYLLQLKIGFNLVGMGWIKLRSVLFREGIPPASTPPQQQHLLQSDTTTAAPFEGGMFGAIGAHQIGSNGISAARAGRDSWDPWRADSMVHVAYEMQRRLSQQNQQQQQQQQQKRQGDGLFATPEGSGGSAGNSQGSQSVEGQCVVWDNSSVPPEWTWEVFAAAERGRRIPSRQSICALEVDAVVHDILNREEATYVSLECATPDQQLVSSLLPMWQQERWRLGGASIPPPPSSPPRRPQPLCPAVEAVREEFKVIAKQYAVQLDTAVAAVAAKQQLQQHAPSPAPTSPSAAAPPSQQQGIPFSTPAAAAASGIAGSTSVPVSPAPTPLRNLLAASQPANKTIGTSRQLKKTATRRNLEQQVDDFLALQQQGTASAAVGSDTAAAAASAAQEVIPATPLGSHYSNAAHCDGANAGAIGTSLVETAANRQLPVELSTPQQQQQQQELFPTGIGSQGPDGPLVDTLLLSQLHSKSRNSQQHNSQKRASRLSSTPAAAATATASEGGVSASRLRRRTSAALATAAAAMAAGGIHPNHAEARDGISYGGSYPDGDSDSAGASAHQSEDADDCYDNCYDGQHDDDDGADLLFELAELAEAGTPSPQGPSLSSPSPKRRRKDWDTHASPRHSTPATAGSPVPEWETRHHSVSPKLDPATHSMAPDAAWHSMSAGQEQQQDLFTDMQKQQQGTEGMDIGSADSNVAAADEHMQTPGTSTRSHEVHDAPTVSGADSPGGWDAVAAATASSDGRDSGFGHPAVMQTPATELSQEDYAAYITLLEQLEAQRQQRQQQAEESAELHAKQQQEKQQQEKQQQRDSLQWHVQQQLEQAEAHWHQHQLQQPHEQANDQHYQQQQSTGQLESQWHDGDDLIQDNMVQSASINSGHNSNGIVGDEDNQLLLQLASTSTSAASADHPPAAHLAAASPASVAATANPAGGTSSAQGTPVRAQGFRSPAVFSSQARLRPPAGHSQSTFVLSPARIAPIATAPAPAATTMYSMHDAPSRPAAAISLEEASSRAASPRAGSSRIGVPAMAMIASDWDKSYVQYSNYYLDTACDLLHQQQTLTYGDYHHHHQQQQQHWQPPQQMPDQQQQQPQANNSQLWHQLQQAASHEVQQQQWQQGGQQDPGVDSDAQGAAGGFMIPQVDGTGDDFQGDFMSADLHKSSQQGQFDSTEAPQQQQQALAALSEQRQQVGLGPVQAALQSSPAMPLSPWVLDDVSGLDRSSSSIQEAQHLSQQQQNQVIPAANNCSPAAGASSGAATGASGGSTGGAGSGTGTGTAGVVSSDEFDFGDWARCRLSATPLSPDLLGFGGAKSQQQHTSSQQQTQAMLQQQAMPFALDIHKDTARQQQQQQEPSGTQQDLGQEPTQQQSPNQQSQPQHSNLTEGQEWQSQPGPTQDLTSHRQADDSLPSQLSRHQQETHTEPLGSGTGQLQLQLASSSTTEATIAAASTASQPASTPATQGLGSSGISDMVSDSIELPTQQIESPVEPTQPGIQSQATQPLGKAGSVADEQVADHHHHQQQQQQAAQNMDATANACDLLNLGLTPAAMLAAHDPAASHAASGQPYSAQQQPPLARVLTFGTPMSSYKTMPPTQSQAEQEHVQQHHQQPLHGPAEVMLDGFRMPQQHRQPQRRDMWQSQPANMVDIANQQQQGPQHSQSTQLQQGDKASWTQRQQQQPPQHLSGQQHHPQLPAQQLGQQDFSGGSLQQQQQQQQQQQLQVGLGSHKPARQLNGRPSCECLIVMRPHGKPPDPSTAADDMADMGLAHVVHQEPFYGTPADKPPHPALFAGREFKIPSAADMGDFTAHAFHCSSNSAAANAEGPATEFTAAVGTTTACTGLARLKAALRQSAQQQQVQADMMEVDWTHSSQDSALQQQQPKQQHQHQRSAVLEQQLHQALQKAAHLPQRFRGVFVFKLPVEPPTRAQTNAWLTAEAAQTRLGHITRSRAQQRGSVLPYGATCASAAAAAGSQRHAAARGEVATTAAAATAAGAWGGGQDSSGTPAFVMDANTGRFVPVSPAGGRHQPRAGQQPGGLTAAATLGGVAKFSATGAAADGVGNSQTTSDAFADGELGLLATPALLLSLSSQPPDDAKDEKGPEQLLSKPAVGVSRRPEAAATGAGQDLPPAQQQLLLGLPATISTQGGDGTANYTEVDGTVNESDTDSEYEDPPSPKYDERTFFFSEVMNRPSTKRRRKHKPAIASSPAATQQPVGTQPPAPAAATAPTAAGTPPLGAAAGIPHPARHQGLQDEPGLGLSATPKVDTTSTSMRMPGHSEHITPPAAPGSCASRPNAAAAVGAVGKGGQKQPSQLGFKQEGGPGVGGRGGPRFELSILAVEVHADSRGSLLPDPRYDAVRVVALVMVVPPHPNSKSSSSSQTVSKAVKYLVWDDKHPAAVAAAKAQAATQQQAAAAAAAAQKQWPAAAAAGAKRGTRGAAAVADAAAAAASARQRLHLPSLPVINAPVASCPPDRDWDGLLQILSLNGSIDRITSTQDRLQSMKQAAKTWGQGMQQRRHHHQPSGQHAAADQRLAQQQHISTAEAADLPVPVQLHYYATEQALLQGFCAVIQALDPDVIVGWDIQQGSIGYLADRGVQLGFNVLRAASRTPELPGLKEGSDDAWGRQHSSGLHCTGRLLLNVWRLMSGELKLSHYSLEVCVAAVLRRRVPQVGQAVMAGWFSAGHAGGRWRCLSRVAWRACLVLDLLDTLDLPGRTAELARTFGIDFFSVLNRGSQYRVESMLVRLAHSQNYLALSPSREQVGSQPATEAIPLVIEPESRMYSCPVAVLDFQSLYPSLIIAYNLCYTTCVGRPAHAAAATAAAAVAADSAPVPSQATPGQAQHLQESGGVVVQPQHPAGTGARLGVSSYAPPAQELLPGGAADPGGLVLAPNGVAFLPPSVRPGVLPRLLHEILATRVMVKAAMKRSKADKVLQRCLNARQFGLKMIANVSYGYTSASFSGRMPCAELADAIVQSGRVTLENAIHLVEGHPSWRARVVYGDTDSLFVALPGRSREEAHNIGFEIASAVTAANPRPVTLKMDKVYYPCILQTKKRYVGFKYESDDQLEPEFEAKGIETVRRDSCPAVAKMLEACLRILFSSKDLSAVKDYCMRQWCKILSNRVSIQDFVFCKEVRLGTYSPNAATLPPAAIVAAKSMAVDPRAEPRYAERVPYVVVAGAPGSRLVDLVVAPQVLVQQDTSRAALRLHANYYITKQIIPALERVLTLVGADVRSWFSNMRKPTRLLPQKRPTTALALPAPGSIGAGGTVAGPSGSNIGNSSKNSKAQVLNVAVAAAQEGAGGASGFGLAAALAGFEAMVVGGTGTSGSVPAGRNAANGPAGSLLPGFMALSAAGVSAASATIDTYYLSRHCAVCDELTRAAEPLCERCRAQPQVTGAVLAARAARLERQHQHLVRLCQSCGGDGGWNVRHGGVMCASLDCGVYYERYKVMGELRGMSAVAAAGLQLL